MEMDVIKLLGGTSKDGSGERLTQMAVVHLLSHFSPFSGWNNEAMAGVQKPSCDIEVILQTEARTKDGRKERDGLYYWWQ